MNITLVSTIPPSRGTLNEYGWHFAQSLRRHPEVEHLTLLVDELPVGQVYPDLGDDVTIIPCWRFNDWKNPFRIAQTAKRLDTDAVILNLQFASFGDKKVPAGLGLCLPFLLKGLGLTTITLLHNIMETIDLKSAGYASHPLQEWLTRMGGKLATRMLLCSDKLALTIPKYLKILKEQYGAKNTFHAPHGSFQQPQVQKEVPKDLFRIMTFGKFGTYKKVEPLVEAYRALLAKREQKLELVIAGSDSPKAAGYLESVKQLYAGTPGLHFTGYVAEEDVPELFTDSSVVVFPYTSTTGSSGVLHQAGSYARAAVMPEIGDFVEVIESEGYTGEYFRAGDSESLANALENLMESPARLQEIGEQNFEASVGIPLDEVVNEYLDQVKLIKGHREAVDLQIICGKRFDIWAVQRLGKALAKPKHEHSTLCFDLSKVRFLDNAAMRYLEELAQTFEVRVTNPSPSAQLIFDLAGFDLEQEQLVA